MCWIGSTSEPFFIYFALFIYMRVFVVLFVFWYSCPPRPRRTYLVAATTALKDLEQR